MRQHVLSCSLFKALTRCVCLFSCLFSLNSYADNAQLQGVKEEISRQISQLDTQKKKQSELETDLKQQELTIARLSKEMFQLQKEIDSHNNKIVVLKKEIATLSEKEKRDQALLNQLITTQYKQGKHSDIKLFLEQDTPARKDRLSIYAHSISQKVSQLIQDIELAQQTLNTQKQSIYQLIQKRQHELISKQSKKRFFTLEQEKRKRTLKALKSKVQQNQGYLTNLKKSELNLKKELDAIKKNSIKMDGLNAKRHKLPWPVWGRVLHNFGQKQTSELKWKGLVISKTAGTSVKAIADGKVVFADWLRGYGLMLVLDHGKGDMSLYGYNQTLLKKIGDSVRGGDSLALVGDSGGQEQSALYFEIRRKGEPVNPRLWLKKGK